MPEIPLGTVVGPQGPPGPKGDTGTFSPEDLQRISDLESGKVDKVSGKGLSTNDYTTADKNAVATIGNKVDKVSGKGLSTNDYTTAEKSKLANIAAEANKTLIDATLSNAGQAADAKATGDAITFLREYLKSMDVSRTASGNPATFVDGTAADVKDLRVTITPAQSGSGDPSPTNIRPITGINSVTVTRTGKNLIHLGNFNSSKNGVTAVCNNGVVTFSGTSTDFAQLSLSNVASLTPGQYILSGCPAGGSGAKYDLRIDNNTVDYGSGVTFDVAKARLANIYWTIRSGVNTNGLVFRPMIRRASGTDATFETYQGQTVTVSLTDGANPLTVYGGTLDVTTGTLSVTWANIASYNGEALPGRWISDRDVYASGATPTTGAQVVYELATPVTYQLTPQQLATLHGYNAVSTDSASVSVTYKADTSII